MAASRLPAMEPVRIAMKVPASTKALPAKSSLPFRCCGRRANLAGPKKVDCVPMQKSRISRPAIHWQCRAMAARSISTISMTFTIRQHRALSTLSTHVPAAAEKRKNGRIKSAMARLVRTPARAESFVTRKVTMVRMAHFRKLSLKAPEYWVIKSGMNRRFINSVNWL